MLYAQIGATDAKLRGYEHEHMDLEIFGDLVKIIPSEKVNPARRRAGRRDPGVGAVFGWTRGWI